MTTENQNEQAGAAGNSEPTPPPAASAPAPKVEVRDGATFMEVGGKMVKMVKESDLMAAKQSLEKQIETQQTTHNQAIDAAQLELSAERQKVADLNAKLTEAQNAQGEGAVSNDEIARIKQERQDALTKVETLTAESSKALEYRRQLILAKYPGVTDEQLSDKSMVQLDSFEEALKALSSSRGGGIGPYAAGAGTGQPQPMSDYDRRKAALEGATVGSRSAQPQ